MNHRRAIQLRSLADMVFDRTQIPDLEGRHRLSGQIQNNRHTFRRKFKRKWATASRPEREKMLGVFAQEGSLEKAARGIEPRHQQRRLRPGQQSSLVLSQHGQATKLAFR